MSVFEKLKALERQGHLLYLNGIDIEIHDEIVAVVRVAEEWVEWCSTVAAEEGSAIFDIYERDSAYLANLDAKLGGEE